MSLAPYLTVNFHPSVSAPLLFPVFLSHQLPLYLCGSGVVINGELIGAKTLQNSKLKTYFGTVGVFYRTEGVMVTVRTDRINVVEGKNNHSFSWSGTAHINTNGCVCVYVWVCERWRERLRERRETVNVCICECIGSYFSTYWYIKRSFKVSFFFLHFYLYSLHIILFLPSLWSLNLQYVSDPGWSVHNPVTSLGFKLHRERVFFHLRCHENASVGLCIFPLWHPLSEKCNSGHPEIPVRTKGKNDTKLPFWATVKCHIQWIHVHGLSVWIWCYCSTDKDIDSRAQAYRMWWLGHVFNLNTIQSLWCNMYFI